MGSNHFIPTKYDIIDFAIYNYSSDSYLRFLILGSYFNYYIPILLFSEEQFGEKISFLASFLSNLIFLTNFTIFKPLVKGGFRRQIQKESYRWGLCIPDNHFNRAFAKSNFGSPPYSN